MTQFVADGEFGIETIEATNLYEAAVAIAKKHAGLDNDDICRDPFWFTVAPAECPDNTREFQAQWSPDDGLEVHDSMSGELL